jgi:hypothetical protein
MFRACSTKDDVSVSRFWLSRDATVAWGVVGLTPRGPDAVARHRQPPRLQPLLQLGLGVFGPLSDVGGVDHIAEQPRDQSPGGRKAAIDKGGTDHRLERIGKDGCAMRAAAARFALAQPQGLGQSVAQGHLVQTVLTNEVRSHTGQVTLITAGKVFIKQAGNRQAQHRITQKFKPLVVLDTITSVGHGQGQQARVDKCIAKPVLKRIEARIHQ